MTVSSEAQYMTESTPQDIYTYLTGLLQQVVPTYLEQEKIEIDANQLPIDLRLSAQASFGDYSAPVMSWSRQLRRPPIQIAEALTALLQTTPHPEIAEINATRPGYINFRLRRSTVGKDIIDRVLEAGPDFGQHKMGIGTKVIVEHTNINSNKAAHVGHLRNSCIGDTVVRMLRSQGYQVEANNYIDDSGVQVADVVVGFTLLQQGVLQLAEGNEQLPDESFDYFCSRVYVGVGKVYEDKDSDVGQRASQLRREVLHAIEHGAQPESGPNYPELAGEVSHKIVQAHLKTMSRLNISYDLLPWESAILHAGLWKKTFEMLRERELLEKPETGHAAGCWILPFGDGESQTSEGDRTSDKILVRSDGTATYTAKDIAYQLWKFGLADTFDVDFQFVPWGIQHDGRKLWSMRTPHDQELQSIARASEAPAERFGHARRVINVIDVRQSYLQQVVYESLRRLGYADQADNSTHLAYEVVTLSAPTAARLGIDTSDGRENYAMSGRKGIEIKADDLINAAIARMKEVRKQDNVELSEETAEKLASAAIRYFMIRFNLQQIIALDMDEVLRPNGDTGVYLQYAYARANSILRRLEDSGYTIPTTLGAIPQELEQSEWDLLRHIDVYPRRLAEYTEQLSPALLASYAYELAAHFSDFYEHTPPTVREADEKVKAFRALLIQATAQTMNNVLRVLGFEPLERI
ncbi:MAG TPA: arginine--tRNA ligase [Dictyobacter sp.]|jgi:arginyl-tRNA synthetase|nr:arginine--tRNA ligase [Dictyobacter sp.]